MSRPTFVIITLYDIEALGARALHAFLTSKDADIRLLFYKSRVMNDMYSLSDTDIKNIIEALQDIAPDIVGLSFVSAFFQDAVNLTRKIQNNFSAPVIWGGAHAKVKPAESIKHADMVCVGEGEEAVLELYERFSDGRPLKDIQNIWYRENNEIHRNSPGPLIENLDKLPFFDYGSTGKYFIDNKEKLHKADPFTVDTGRGEFFQKRYYIQTTRGCPFRCSYCSNDIYRDLNPDSPAVRTRSVDDVIEELKRARKTFPNMKRVAFRDEVFGMDSNWVDSFCKKYKSEINLPFQISLHPNLVTETLINKLKNAGLIHIVMGIQSGSEKIREEVFNRPTPNQKLLEATTIINRAGITPSYDIIVDNPWESRKDKKDALDFLLKIPHPFNIRMFKLAFLPETQITEKGINEEVINKNEIVGYEKKEHIQMRKSLGTSKDKENLFWSNLISLLPKAFVPRKLLKILNNYNFFRNHPYLVVILARTANFVKVAYLGLSLLFKGEIGWDFIKTQWKKAVKTVK